MINELFKISLTIQREIVLIKNLTTFNHTSYLLGIFFFFLGKIVAKNCKNSDFSSSLLHSIESPIYR